jgi:putative oxidoreductase
MERYLGRFSEPIYAIMRIVVGLTFAMHGLQKMFGVLGGQKMPVSSFPGFGGVIELVAGLLIAIGLLAGWAAFVASGEMAVAYFMVHFPQSFWPIVNKGELAVVYCFVFLYIASRGAGIWSVDGSVRRG